MSTETIPAEQTIDARVDAIARAILYEGYLLYPYRLSALKNRQRWSFGVLYPPNYCALQSGTERAVMQTECFLEANDDSGFTGCLRFLQVADQKTIEREIRIPVMPIGALYAQPFHYRFSFPPLEGVAEARAERAGAGIYKLTVRLANTSAFVGDEREDALCHSLISAQKILQLRSGRFFSALEPPEQLLGTHSCENVGAWPALVGNPNSRDTLISAPIILDDFPALAPESPGDFFDGTEIDELLSLRLMTLSDSEKKELACVDEPLVRELLGRAERLNSDELLKLHGAFRDDPGVQANAKRRVQAGDRVQLHPRGRSDILDLALAGKTATVTSIEHDYEDRTYVCVVLDDDPGRDLGVQGHPGHRFFFAIDEVEPL